MKLLHAAAFIATLGISPLNAAEPAVQVIEAREFKPPTGQDVVRALSKTHPRIICSAEEWAALKARVASDPHHQQLYQNVQAVAADLLTVTPLTHRMLGPEKSLLDTSREAVLRIYALAMMKFIDGDPKWIGRAKAELAALAGFPDWNPSHFLDTAEMTHAMAVGLDWFHADLSSQERAAIVSAIVTKGLRARDRNHLKGYETSEKLNNWAHVCAGGLLAGALAIADEEPRIAAETIESALKILPRAINLWMPDGAWEEGTVYGDYALTYTRVAIESLRRACGATFGLDRVAGLHVAGNGLIFLSGTEAQSFAFADSGSGLAFTSLLWLGQTFAQPVLHQAALESRKGRLAQVATPITYAGRETRFGAGGGWDGLAGLLYLTPPQQAGSPLPLDQRFRGQEIVAFRERWNDPSAAYLALKGGSNRAKHNNLDLGTFVFGGDGVAWAVELGADDYGLAGYFDSATDDGKRWSYYRERTEGQNTLVFDGQNQPVDGEAAITMFDSTAIRGLAVVDLTRPYRHSAKAVKRGVCLKRDGRVAIVQDEIEPDQATSLTWSMHTRADVLLAGRTATLTAKGKTCVATLLSPPGASFTVQEVNLAAPQKPTPGLRKIMVQLGKLTRPTTVTVELRLGKSQGDATAMVPLADWLNEDQSATRK